MAPRNPHAAHTEPHEPLLPLYAPRFQPSPMSLCRTLCTSRSGNQHARSSGIALIITLGILTVISLAAVAFVVTMRVERLAARNALNRTMARQYVDVALEQALAFSDTLLVGSQSTYPVQGWYTTNDFAYVSHSCEGDCMSFPETNATQSTIALFRGSVTNLVPRVLAAQAGLVESGWRNIVETNGLTTGATAGRVAFLVINLSGMSDVNYLNDDRRMALGEPSTAATNLLRVAGGFRFQLDLLAANQGQAVSNLVTCSYDVGPDVYSTGTNVLLGTRDFTNVLASRVDINLITNAITDQTYLATFVRLLIDAGITNNADHIAYNILNYVDTNRIPVGVSDGYRVDYGIKDVPLINEVALKQQPGSNAYRVAIELWYPFVPNDSPDKVSLLVGVYTNATQVCPYAENGLSFATNLPTMAYLSNEFVVAWMTNTICFRESDDLGTCGVWIWPRVFVDGTCVDEALVTGSTVTNWRSAGSIQFADPRANNTLEHAQFYPQQDSLGTTNFNCSVGSLPMVIADAPMLSAGELRHIYVPEMPHAVLDLGDPRGAACRDRFTVLTNNTPVRGLVHANTPYTNVWKALLSDVTIGWTNSVTTTHAARFSALDPTEQGSIVAAAASAAWSGIAYTNGDVGSWNCYEEMLPPVASNLDLALGGAAGTNAEAFAQRGDILAGIADRVSFRQNVFLVVLCGQRLSPRGRVLADQRAAAVIVRDAFTGRWVVNHMLWLTE